MAGKYQTRGNVGARGGKTGAHHPRKRTSATVPAARAMRAPRPAPRAQGQSRRAGALPTLPALLRAVPVRMRGVGDRSLARVARLAISPDESGTLSSSLTSRVSGVAAGAGSGPAPRPRPPGARPLAPRTPPRLARSAGGFERAA